MPRARTAKLICLAAVSLSLPAQAPAPKWTGVWTLDPRQSTFEPILVPGAPPDFTIRAETMTLSQANGRLHLSADITYSAYGATHSTQEEDTLQLNGEATVLGPITLTYRAIDDNAFDILSHMRTEGAEFTEVSHFAVSTDILTETKTQTLHTTGAPAQTSKSVLVFNGRR